MSLSENRIRQKYLKYYLQKLQSGYKNIKNLSSIFCEEMNFEFMVQMRINMRKSCTIVCARTNVFTG